MKLGLWRISSVISIVLITVSIAFAQGGRSAISGVVKDEQGGVLPGVTVVATDATGTNLNAVTNENGVFAFPSIPAGTYKVTLTLNGFKQTVLDNVVAVAASSAAVNVTLTVGGMEETVEVIAETALIQSQATTVTTTLNTDSIQKLPMITRNVMQSIPAMLVGVDQTGGDRSATINGLPQNAVKLTIDGIDVKPVQGDNATSSFYAYIYPSADSMEAVTVPSGQDAGSSGDGTASVRFVTKSGTNRYSGSFFSTFATTHSTRITSSTTCMACRKTSRRFTTTAQRSAVRFRFPVCWRRARPSSSPISRTTAIPTAPRRRGRS